MKRVLTMFARNRLSLVALSMAAFFAIANVSAVGAANPTPFKVLRAATNANGTFFVGGSGFTVSHPSTSNYHVSFPKGTWNSLGVACYFVPEVQSVFTPPWLRSPAGGRSATAVARSTSMSRRARTRR
jgi:hypothetical protein